METKLQQQSPQNVQTSRANLTGIPTQMKLDFEQRSGLSFDDVRVHYNSDKPAQLQALAYTQGTQVYVGPRQERHLKHELGHVVQQKTSSITATKKINGIYVNDNATLEDQADSFAHITKKFTNQENTQISNRDGIIQRAQYKSSMKKSTNQKGNSKNKGPTVKKPKRKSINYKWTQQAKQRALQQSLQINQANAIITSKKTISNTVGTNAQAGGTNAQTHQFVDDARVPTFFSYKFANGNVHHQGPHTIAHTYWVIRLNDISVSWENIYKSLILPNSKDTVLQILMTEGQKIVPQKYASDYELYYNTLRQKVHITGNTVDTSYFSNIDLARRYYAQYGSTATVFVANNQQISWKDISDVGSTMLKLLEMHPYNTYGWNRDSSRDITSFESDGKGERNIKYRPNDFDLIVDAHGFFQDADGYANFLSSRLPWLQTVPFQLKTAIERRFVYKVCSDIDDCIGAIKGGCKNKITTNIPEIPEFFRLVNSILIDSLPINFRQVLNNCFGEDVAKKYDNFMLIRKNYTHHEIRAYLNYYNNLASIIVNDEYYQHYGHLQWQGTPPTQSEPRYSKFVEALQDIYGKPVNLH